MTQTVSMTWKRGMSLLLALALVISLVALGVPALAAGGSFGGGSGTQADPYIITDQEDLEKITSNMSAHYALGNDIVLSGTWTPIGSNSGAFTGSLDGQGYTISGLTMSGRITYAGLFGYVTGTIKNVNVEIASAGITSTTNSANVAGLVGQLHIGGVIENCSVTGGTVRGSGSEPCVGGLVGRVVAATVTGSYATVAATGSASSYAGGLIGRAQNSGTTGAKIENCYATGTATGYYAGGLIGYLTYSATTVTNCFSTGVVVKAGTFSSIGGLVGSYNDGTLSGCYFDSTTAGTTTAAGYGSPSGITAVADLANSSVFSAWDTDVWLIEAGSLPVLLWTVAADESVPVDKTDLANAIGAVQALTESDYTAESWTALSNTLAAAVIINDDPDAVQEDVDTAVSALQVAMDALVLYVAPVADYSFRLVVDGENYNVGETVQVRVYADSATHGNLASLELRLNFDESKLSFSGAQEGDLATVVGAGGVARLTYVGEAVTIPAQGLLLATIELTVLDGFTESVAASLAFSGGAKAAPAGANLITYYETALLETGEAVTVNLYNLTVTFQAGTGTTMADAVAYVKYNDSTLYTGNDYLTAFTIPAPTPDTGYRLADDVWGHTEGTSFTASAVYTAQAVQVWTVTFYEYDGSVSAAQTVDEGGFAVAPTAEGVANMDFAGWYVVTASADTYDGAADLYTNEQIAARAVTGSAAYKAHFTASAYEITIPAGITVTSGVTDNKAAYGTDVTFTLDSGSTQSGFVPVVSYTVDGVTETLAPDGAGIYTIPGSAITGAVTISLDQLVDGTITFIDYATYYAAPAGYKVMKLTLSGSAPDGVTYQYNGAALLWSEAYGAYVAMVEDALTVEAAMVEITAVVESDGISQNMTIDYSGDLVSPMGLDIYDAQVIFELYNGLHTDGYGYYSASMRLMADVTGDGVVDMADVQYVLALIPVVAG